MAKRSLDEILAKFREIVGDDTRDEVLEMLEDLTDSYSDAPEPSEDLSARVTELEGELEAVRKRYRDRFFGRDEEKEEIANDTTVTDTKPDGDEIKIKDLFKEKKED